MCVIECELWVPDYKVLVIEYGVWVIECELWVTDCKVLVI